MATIVQQGQVNTAALIVPGVTVQIVPPSVQQLNGVASNIIGLVGTAQWGPANQPVTVGTYQQYVQNFGNLQARTYDLGTPVMVGIQQGANNFKCVRVTDSTDVAAFVQPTAGAIESIYNLIGGTGYSTGLGNTICVAGTGTGAVLKCTYTSGAISAVAVVAGGTGWGASGTTATVLSGNTTSGSGAVLAVTVTSGVITAVTVSSGGSAYPTGPTLTLCGPFTSSAGLGVTSSGGAISALFITNGGGGLTTNPSLGIADSTGTGASASVSVSAITYTAAHTGTLGNSITIQTSPATNPTGTTMKLIVACPGLNTEIFDNIVAPTGQAIWATVAAAVNNGIGNQSASKIIVASLPGSTGGPVYSQTYTLSGGTDGSGITSTQLIGTDGAGISRTGMYALRGSNCSLGHLADNVTFSTFSLENAYGLGEGTYMIQSGPSGDVIATEITSLQGSGAQSGTSYALGLCFGDWVYWADPVNNVTRLVNPAAFKVGLLGNLAPNNSAVNKPIYGVVGTQKTGQANSTTVQAYSTADLSQLFAAGIDVMANPSPGGFYFSFGRGCNTATNNAVNGDNYTTMTNFIAKTLLAGMGLYVGQPITSSLTQAITATLQAFLGNLQNQGILSPLSSGANCFTVVCSAPGTGNNPLTSTSLGSCNASVQVQYESILLFLVISLQGGQGVAITTNTTVANAA